MTCTGCGTDFINFYDNIAVCMDCIKARHRTVLNQGRCTCGRKRRENPKLHKVGSRTWKTCDRCLGSTGQLS